MLCNVPIIFTQVKHCSFSIYTQAPENLAPFAGLVSLKRGTVQNATRMLNDAKEQLEVQIRNMNKTVVVHSDAITEPFSFKPESFFLHLFLEKPSEPDLVENGNI